MRKIVALLIFSLASSVWAQTQQAPADDEPMTVKAQPADTGKDHCDAGLPIMAGITVTFADNSSTFKPTPGQITLLADVLQAKLVMIKGRTSTTIPSAKDEAIALARAISARNWLIGLGVSPLKIYLNYVPAGDHKEDNSTKEGRAANQRVDIEAYFIDINPERTP